MSTARDAGLGVTPDPSHAGAMPGQREEEGPPGPAVSVALGDWEEGMAAPWGGGQEPQNESWPHLLLTLGGRIPGPQC